MNIFITKRQQRPHKNGVQKALPRSCCIIRHTIDEYQAFCRQLKTQQFGGLIDRGTSPYLSVFTRCYPLQGIHAVSCSLFGQVID